MQATIRYAKKLRSTLRTHSNSMPNRWVPWATCASLLVCVFVFVWNSATPSTSAPVQAWRMKSPEISRAAPTQNTSGFVFAAQGKDFVLECVTSALGVRRFSDKAKHIALLTDTQGLEVVRNLSSTPPDLFEYVIDISDRLPRKVLPKGRSFKILGLLLTPYHHTVFLDSDASLCRNGIDGLFALLENGIELAAVQENFGPRFVTNESAAIAAGDAFPQINTGVVAYRHTEGVQELFQTWHDRMLVTLNEHNVYNSQNSQIKRFLDQPEFHWQLWKRLGSIRFLPLPKIFNCRDVLPEIDSKIRAHDDGTVKAKFAATGWCGFVDATCVVEHANLSGKKKGWARQQKHQIV